MQRRQPRRRRRRQRSCAARALAPARPRRRAPRYVERTRARSAHARRRSARGCCSTWSARSTGGRASTGARGRSAAPPTAPCSTPCAARRRRARRRRARSAPSATGAMIARRGAARAAPRRGLTDAAARVHRLGSAGPRRRHPAARRARSARDVLTASAASLAPSAATRRVRPQRRGDGGWTSRRALGELARALRGAASCSARAARTSVPTCSPAGCSTSCSCRSSPLLAGGEPGGGEALRILAGDSSSRPPRLELLAVLRGDCDLFRALRRALARARLARDD